MRVQRKGSAEFGVVARRLDARRGVGEGGISACAEHCSNWWIRPPLPAPGLPQSLAPSVWLPFVFPVAMAAAVAGKLRGGLLPQAGKEWPRSSLRVAAGAH